MYSSIKLYFYIKKLSRDYQVACSSRDTYACTYTHAHARTTAAPIYSTTTLNPFLVLCSNVLNHHVSMYLAQSIASNQAYSQLLSRFRDTTFDPLPPGVVVARPVAGRSATPHCKVHRRVARLPLAARLEDDIGTIVRRIR